ncbi:MAG: cation acetate symporter [Planctomycetaceae bacterium]
MIYEPNLGAVLIFGLIVAATLGLSFWLGKQARSASGFFAAGGHIHWFVNGVAFAGDYLSAASFLGICGMISFYGYDGFLYSIGYLAGWIVALFVVAEPLKRMGKYTFADALDSRFQSRGIKLAAAVSTLAVSVFYLIPQMVGAGVLVTPLFGLPHWAGVVMVGAVVILIVTTAGMVSTTYVQFLKGGLLIVFSTVLVALILNRGLTVATAPVEAQTVTSRDDVTYIDGKPQGTGEGETDIRPVGSVSQLPEGKSHTGPLGPLEFLRTFQQSEIVVWRSTTHAEPDGATTTVYHPTSMPGHEVLRPGNHPSFAGLRSENPIDKLNFLSLMLALFCGTASLPHILIRYYTVKDQASARKSTIVGIGCIGFFYVLTLFLGLGAMTSGALDVTDSNMAAPLLARTFGESLFAIISAIAFTTVLGTVSGLIIAASGAVVHDLMKSVLKIDMSDRSEVRVARIASVFVGGIAIVLGIAFGGMNVNYLVGWAFSVAASANLPALVMLLFWKGTTKQGIVAAILVGMISSLAWILLSGDTYKAVYGWPAEDAIVPFSQPGIVTIPLGFATLIVVSLLTRKRGKEVMV